MADSRRVDRNRRSPRPTSRALQVDRANVVVKIEQLGPLRAVLRVLTPYVYADGVRGYEIEKRVIMWAVACHWSKCITL